MMRVAPHRRCRLVQVMSLALAAVSSHGAAAARRAVHTTRSPRSPHHSVSSMVVNAAGGHSGVQTFVFEPKGQHTSTMFILHGLGDTAEGWAPAVAYHYGPALPNTKFVLPTAPTQQVTLNMGMAMPSWYDIVGLSDRDAESCAGIEESRQTLLHLVEQEVESGTPLDRIILSGFSQGGAVSLYTGLQMDEPPAALVIKSSYLACPSAVEAGVNKEALRTLPILFCHGDSDPMVLPRWGAKSADTVEEWGAQDVERKTYPGMQHSACEEELDDVVQFVKRVLGE